MGFQPWVPQQDSNWEIRVVVLLSLLLQVLLIFLGPMRKRTSWWLPLFAIWSCYLLSDWVADLALGLLLNTMGVIGGSNSSPVIFAFWTPFLLLHLGGPDTITSFSAEDNELWLRHFIGLLFELFSAIIIIMCSVRGNPLIGATILVLVAGVIKYCERTYSLYLASIESFRTNILGPPDPGPNYAKFMTIFNGMEKAGLVVEIALANGEAEQAQREEEGRVLVRHVFTGTKSMEARAYEFFLIFRRLFVNLSLSSRERQMAQAFFVNREGLGPAKAFEVVKMELNFVYDMVYTKAAVSHTNAGRVLRFICSSCIVSALVIFFYHDKGGMKRVDVGITYTLLLGALALDVVAMAMLLLSDRAAIFLEKSRWSKYLGIKCLGWLTRAVRRLWRPRRWSETTWRLNLIDYTLFEPNHYFIGRCLLTISKRLDLEESLRDMLFILHMPLYMPLNKHDITEGADKGENHLLKFIFDGLKAAASKPEMTKEEIMRFCKYRGEHVLEGLMEDIKMSIVKEDDDKETKEEVAAVIMDSVKEREFDESLLMWHIATDLCLLPGKPGPDAKDTGWRRRVAKTLSEYMLYLLVKQPDMLSAKTGVWLMRYQDTCAEARLFFRSVTAARWWIDQGGHGAERMLLGVNTSQQPVTVKGDRSNSVLFDAVILAKALRKLDGGLRWEVVVGVWGEILIYTASTCRGSTHMQQLNRGGELLTLLWFLMENIGLIGDTYDVRGGEGRAKIIVIDQ
ncbi:hypothetical protein ACP4OV_011931 [Aristida adscensionis]